MSITREQVADLHEGDIVELARADDLTAKATGAVVELNGRLYVGPFAIRWQDGTVPVGLNRLTLTVVSRAPRPLYVNHDRAEPVPGDVVRDADDGGRSRVWVHLPHVMFQPDGPWVTQSGNEPIRRRRSYLPARLRLLVDGTTGQVVQ